MENPRLHKIRGWQIADNVDFLHHRLPTEVKTARNVVYFR
jgi:hypothetical protein